MCVCARRPDLVLADVLGGEEVPPEESYERSLQLPRPIEVVVVLVRRRIGERVSSSQALRQLLLHQAVHGRAQVDDALRNKALASRSNQRTQ